MQPTRETPAPAGEQLSLWDWIRRRAVFSKTETTASQTPCPRCGGMHTTRIDAEDCEALANI